MAELPSVPDQVFQQGPFRLKREAQAAAALQIKGHGGFERTRFHGRTSPGQGWATRANWDTWVPKYLERHCESPRTHERYHDAWKWLALWLQTKRFHSPRDITYRNAIEYVDWRTSYKKRTGKTAGRNTAILELKTLAMIMGEAVRLGHAEANPLVSIKLRRDKAEKKSELTDSM